MEMRTTGAPGKVAAAPREDRQDEAGAPARTIATIVSAARRIPPRSYSARHSALSRGGPEAACYHPAPPA